jgi:DNA (cytosine-5)-methyltransferase 1
VPPGSSQTSIKGRVAGLFAGIGGIEIGLHEAGFSTELLCEIDEAARSVLASSDILSDADFVDDVATLDALPSVDIVTAGFPCQDLSQAGRTAGIRGARSSLVDHVFRLLSDPLVQPRWIVMENVPFMLQLQRGRAMHYLVDRLEGLGLRWAYRIVDARAFGLPQRRRRVILVASREENPCTVLFGADHGREPDPGPGDAFGFYWTEGLRGLGWARDAVPTLKGGSTVGIPSPPAVWIPHDDIIGTPDIRDAERLQGFREGWTRVARLGSKRRGDGVRWRLVGNAVSVPLARWLGHWLAQPGRYDGRSDEELAAGSRWPTAAWGGPGRVTRRADLSMWPVSRPFHPLRDFLEYPLHPLSHRAISGFNARADKGRLRFDPAFRAATRRHEARMGPGSSRAVAAA